MQKSKRPVRVFETRESEDYEQVLSEVLSVQHSPEATYPDLLSASYELDADLQRKLYGDQHDNKITRIINIDYIGMTATVLLDKNKTYTRNSHLWAKEE